nr:LysR family transcriptional regulator [Ruminococcus sp. NK3A76]
MLRQIQHFQTVIQENSFTEAAELCHISQSGISRSIQSLEDEIGAKLIIRKNRSFELMKCSPFVRQCGIIETYQLGI